jgi:hypothetical protein
VYVHIFHPIFVREGFFKNVTEDFHREIGRLKIYEIDIQSSPVIAYGHVMGMYSRYCGAVCIVQVVGGCRRENTTSSYVRCSIKAHTAQQHPHTHMGKV